MTVQATMALIFADTFSGIIKNLPYFILIIWAVRTIAKEMPRWIQQVFKEMQKARTIDRALAGRIE